jgi:hypothetical protein
MMAPCAGQPRQRPFPTPADERFDAAAPAWALYAIATVVTTVVVDLRKRPC